MALSSVTQNASGTSTTTNSTAVKETCPLHKTALTAQALFQQVQLSMNNDSEEGSTENDSDSSEDLGDDLAHRSGSDVETSDIIFELADPNKKPVSPTHLGKHCRCHLTLK